MQNSQLPTKWVVPFAAGDGSKVELPVTTAAPGRASLNLGFPPLTMQPLEVGGLPPQGEDFNGAMNQVARFVWWAMAGGAIPFDATWAADSHINGYPLGAQIAAADLQGVWISQVENNVVNPDTLGTGWAPAFAYGIYAATSLTGGTVTLTPLQAMKPRITFAGALTSNAVIVLPNWLYNWELINNTTGNFSLTVKTAAGAGIVVPPSGQPVAVYGDGTNIVSAAPGNSTGRLLRTTVYSRIAGVQNIAIDGGAPTTTGAGVFTPLAATTAVAVEVMGAGGGAAGCPTMDGTHKTAAGGAGGGAYGEGYYTSAFAGVTITVGASGAGGAPGLNNGSSGGTSSFGALLTAAGGNGSVASSGVLNTDTAFASGAGGGTTVSGANIQSRAGGAGGLGMLLGVSQAGGAGGASSMGGGSPTGAGAGVAGGSATSPGAGGAGGAVAAGGSALSGGSGGSGLIIVREYA